MERKQESEMLIAVFNSLNNIEVKGRGNVCNLSGCLQILGDILDARTKEEQGADKQAE
jgi:hypothetical protein